MNHWHAHQSADGAVGKAQRNRRVVEKNAMALDEKLRRKTGESLQETVLGINRTNKCKEPTRTKSGLEIVQKPMK